jgi:predicted DNA-binding protein with PD1-like motif
MNDHFHAFRLHRGQDLYDSLCSATPTDGRTPSYAVATAVGSLTRCRLRLAGATASDQTLHDVEGPLEIVSLTGTIAANGGHFHIAVADAEGRVVGGHLTPGALVDTTCEVVLACLAADGIEFVREIDETAGFRELVVR